MGKLVCDSTASSAVIPWRNPTSESIDLQEQSQLLPRESVPGLEDQQKRHLHDKESPAVVFRLTHGGDMDADVNCLFSVLQKETCLKNIDARDLLTVAQKLIVGCAEHMRLKNNDTLCCYTRKRRNRIPNLSEEIIFNILLRFPANVIYDVMRFVCWSWYNIIHDRYFIYKHLHQSTQLLLAPSLCHPGFAHSVEITRECDVIITKLGYKFPGVILATYDGLVLCKDRRSCFTLYISNPVTKQHRTLPSVSFLGYSYISYGIGYVESTGHYKIVSTYIPQGLLQRCAILTLGVDTAWRHFDMERTRGHPITVGGFMYWRCVVRTNYMLGLDVENETFHRVPLPESCGTTLKMGMYLSFVTEFVRSLSVKVWVLRKTRNWEWVRMADIDITKQKCVYARILIPPKYDHVDLLEWWKNRLYPLRPYAWLQDGEIMIFRIPFEKPSIVHNTKTGKVYSFVMDEPFIKRLDCLHVHSLVFPSNLG